MSAITTHVLDVTRGRPAAGVGVVLHRVGAASTAELARGTTDPDGRVKVFSPTPVLEAGSYRLTFEVGPYFASSGVETFYPRVIIEFEVRDASQHYHVPLLLSPFGYSTYRGS
jgi:5-hydroxyisourate hydrolase